MRVDFTNVSTWKHTWTFHNRDVVWDTLMATWVGEGLAWVQEMTMLPGQEGPSYCFFGADDEIVCETHAEKDHRCTQQETKGTGPLGSRCSNKKSRGSRCRSGATTRRWLTGSVQSKAVVDRSNSYECSKTTAGMVGQGRQFGEKGR